MLGIIGGSGFYQLDGLEVTEQREIQTPYGAPSAAVVFARTDNGNNVAFLPRHGTRHSLLPSEINYRANIFALKSVGVKQLISISAVGSLREDLAPGDFVLPSQYVDNTKGRQATTFFGDGLVAHVSTAKPTCALLSGALQQAAKALKYTVHTDKTYVCVEGPRLGTQAESFFLRDSIKADVVGMTNVPEVFLAREAQISYATLAIITDYDCWMNDPIHHVTVAQVIKKFGDSVIRAKKVIAQVTAIPPNTDEKHRCALAEALLTPPEAHSDSHKALLAVLSA